MEPSALRRTKIIVTLGPATESKEMIGRLIETGVDIFRLNMSHAPHDWVRRVVADIRSSAAARERFIGIMLEHLGGELPLWLAPVQAIVLPVSDRFNGYARAALAELRAAGLRVELDERSESVGRKIRDAELRKIPYMLIVGAREQEQGSVSVREHHGGDLGAMAPGELAERVRAAGGVRTHDAPGGQL